MPAAIWPEKIPGYQQKTVRMLGAHLQGVPRALLSAGFKVFGFSPAGYKVAELTTDSPRDAGQHSVFPSEDPTDARYLVFRQLTGAIPSIDIVNVYRPEGEIAGIVANQVEKLGAKTLWLHPPMVSDLARRVATERGLNFVAGIAFPC